MASNRVVSLFDIPAELRIKIMNHLFKDSTVILTGAGAEHYTSCRNSPESHFRYNILLTCKTLFQEGVRLFFELSHVEYHPESDETTCIRALQYSQTLHIESKPEMVPAILGDFESLKMVRIPKMDFKTHNFHVPANGAIVKLLRDDDNYVAAKKALKKMKGEVTMIVHVDWIILNWFDPGCDPGITYEVDVGAKTATLVTAVDSKYRDTCTCGNKRWKPRVNTEVQSDDNDNDDGAGEDSDDYF